MEKILELLFKFLWEICKDTAILFLLSKLERKFIKI